MYRFYVLIYCLIMQKRGVLTGITWQAPAPWSSSSAHEVGADVS